MGQRHIASFKVRMVALSAGGLAAPRAAADVIPVKSAELRVEDGEVLLNAEFDLALNATLEEALEKGVPLYFVLEVELLRPRWYWLDEKVLALSTTWRVSSTASCGTDFRPPPITSGWPVRSG